MHKRSSKRPRDVNQLARALVAEATGETPAGAAEPEPQKHPAAVALGKLGGAKGGRARAAALSKKRRSEIAKKAARVRWASEKHK